MKKNKGGILHLRIGLNRLFVPDEYGEVGVLYGEQDVTRPDDKIKTARPYSHVAVIEYKLAGKYCKAYYRHGHWKKGKNDELIFHVWSLLR